MKDHWNELITTALGDRAMWVHHSTEVLKSDNFSVEFHGNKRTAVQKNEICRSTHPSRRDACSCKRW